MSMYDELKYSPLHLVSKIAPYSALSSVIAAVIVDGNRLLGIFAHGWSSNSGEMNSIDSIDGSDTGSYVGSDIGSVDMSGEHHYDELKLFGGAIGFILLGGLASFLLLLVEVKLLQLTSSLTVGVLGTVKVCVK